MWEYNRLNLNKTARYAGAILTALLVGAKPADAQDFTAGTVLEKMEPEHRLPFMAGIVEGLAYARFQSDGEKTDGMACIYDWFYQGEKTLETIYAAFERFPDNTPGAVMAALAKRKCGA